MHPALQPRSVPRPWRGPAATLALGLLALAGCASTPPPTAQLAVSSAALASALAAGGAETAPDDLRRARGKLDGANLALAANDNARAATLAAEAQVDAQLAEARARAAQSQKAAQALQESSRVLREELNRKTP